MSAEKKKDKTAQFKELEKDLKKLQKDLQKAKREAQDYLKGWQRAQADYLNYKRRVEKEKNDWEKEAKIDLLKEIFPVLDNLHRAFQHIPASEKNKDWVLGIKQIEAQLEGILQKAGLERIATVAQKFNPEEHEAVLSEKRKGVSRGMILEELEAGYKVGDQIIKPAKVKVAL